MSVATQHRSWWSQLKRFLLYFFLFQLAYIILLRWIDPPITITQLSAWVTGEGLRRDYVRADQIAPYAKLAVLASEDQLFVAHNGFDWEQIQKALEYNERKPNRLRGGSTISQQTAKNVFLWQGRSWLRKGLEVYFTFMIEWIWGKKRILEVYLNVIEMGAGVYGIEAASLYYFKKPAIKLSRHEAALIAASLPNPKLYRIQPPSRYMQRRASFIVGQMRNLSGDEAVRRLVENP
jgi:monofunctional biosynthetic peptidoglycan transglycosylase